MSETLELIIVILLSVQTMMGILSNTFLIFVKMLKRSKCCGSEAVFRNSESIHRIGEDKNLKIEHTEIIKEEK